MPLPFSPAPGKRFSTDLEKFLPSFCSPATDCTLVDILNGESGCGSSSSYWGRGYLLDSVLRMEAAETGGGAKEREIHLSCIKKSIAPGLELFRTRASQCSRVLGNTQCHGTGQSRFVPGICHPGCMELERRRGVNVVLLTQIQYSATSYHVTFCLE
jgi:hypothetical protein